MTNEQKIIESKEYSFKKFWIALIIIVILVFLISTIVFYIKDYNDLESRWNSGNRYYHRMYNTFDEFISGEMRDMENFRGDFEYYIFPITFFSFIGLTNSPLAK